MVNAPHFCRIKTTFASTTTSTSTSSTSTTTNSSSYYYFYNKPINNFNNNDYNFYYCYNNIINSFIKTVIPFIKITNTFNNSNTKQYTQNSNNYTTLKNVQSVMCNKIAFVSILLRSKIFLIRDDFVIIMLNFYLKVPCNQNKSTLIVLQKSYTIDANVVVVVVVCKQYHQYFNYHQNQYHQYCQHNQKHLYNCSRFLQRNCCKSSKTSTSTLTILLSPPSATATPNAFTSVAIKSTTKTSSKNIKTITKTTTSATTTTTISIKSSPFNSSIKFINNTTTSITFTTTTTTSTVRILFKRLDLLRVLQVLLQFHAVYYNWSSTAASVGFLVCYSLLNNISTTQFAAVFFQQQLQQTPITINSLIYHHFHQYLKKIPTGLELHSSYFNNG